MANATVGGKLLFQANCRSLSLPELRRKKITMCPEMLHGFVVRGQGIVDLVKQEEGATCISASAMKKRRHPNSPGDYCYH